MSSVLDHRYEYLNSPYFKKHEYSNFTPFYITVTICSILALTLILLNVFLGCCSRYSDYWQDRYTGNRWLVSLWTSTPHQQPSLDYTELQHVEVHRPRVIYYPRSEPEHSQLHEIQDIEVHHQPRAAYYPPSAPEQSKSPPGYFELKKRESDI